MSKAIINNNFRIFTAQKFVEGLFETQLSNNNLFLWIGKSTPWSNEADPDKPHDTVAARKASFADMLALKKVSPSDASLVIPRYDWTAGTIYSQYDQNGAAYNGTNYDQYEPLAAVSPFFVFTDENNVYKCLSNNSGAASSTKPTGKSTGTTTTADGYQWKFMYSLSPSEIQKFLDVNWVPIKSVTFNDGSDQWTIQQTAVETLNSPPGGHGKDAVTELGAMYVMVSVKLQYNESGKISTDNDFRKYGLVVNPLRYGTGQFYTSLVATMTRNLTLTGVLGTFNPDDHVEGQTSDATARVVDFNNGILRLTEVVGSFQVNEVVRDTESSATGVLSVNTNPDIQPNTGYILHTEHAVPTARASDQLEDFKVVLTF